MSYKKAMAAGAKQQARNAQQVAKSSNVNKSIGGKCMMADCDSPATFQHGRLKVCRDHKDELS